MSEIEVTQADRAFASRWAETAQEHAGIARDAARHRQAAEAAKDARIEQLEAALWRARYEMRRGIDLLMSIETEAMCGDNLAVTLCTFFEDRSEGPYDDSGWSEHAQAAYEEIKDAFNARFAGAERIFEQALRDTHNV